MTYPHDNAGFLLILKTLMDGAALARPIDPDLIRLILIVSQAIYVGFSTVICVFHK